MWKKRIRSTARANISKTANRPEKAKEEKGKSKRGEGSLTSCERERTERKRIISYKQTHRIRKSRQIGADEKEKEAGEGETCFGSGKGKKPKKPPSRAKSGGLSVVLENRGGEQRGVGGIRCCRKEELTEAVKREQKKKSRPLGPPGQCNAAMLLQGQTFKERG